MEIYKYLSLLIAIFFISCGGHKNDRSENNETLSITKILPTPEDSLIYAVLVIEDSLDYASRFNKSDLKWMLEEKYDSVKIELISEDIRKAKAGEWNLCMDFEQATKAMKRINFFDAIIWEYGYVGFCGTYLLSQPSDSVVINQQKDNYISILERELEKPSQAGVLSPEVAYGINFGDTLALMRREINACRNIASSQNTLPWLLKYREGYGFRTDNEFELDEQEFYIFFERPKEGDDCVFYFLVDGIEKLDLDSDSASIFIGKEELASIYFSPDMTYLSVCLSDSENYTKINKLIDIIDKGNVKIELRDKNGVRKIWTLTDETRNARNMASFLNRIDYSKYEW